MAKTRTSRDGEVCVVLVAACIFLSLVVSTSGTRTNDERVANATG